MKDAKLSLFPRTIFNFNLGDHPRDVEVFDPDRQKVTVPGMVQPLRDIINKYVRGGELPVMPETPSFPDAGLDITKLDKIDLAQYKMEVSERINSVVTDYRSRVKENDKLKEERRLNEVESLKKQIIELSKKSKDE